MSDAKYLFFNKLHGYLINMVDIISAIQQTPDARNQVLSYSSEWITKMFIRKLIIYQDTKTFLLQRISLNLTRLCYTKNGSRSFWVERNSFVPHEWRHHVAVQGFHQIVGVGVHLQRRLSSSHAQRYLPCGLKGE